jgi:capsule polysaccharide modification protein KpsS
MYGDIVDRIYPIEPHTNKGTRDEKRSIVFAVCLLKPTCIKHNKYVVNQKLSLPSTRYMYLRWPFFLYETSF